MSRVFCIYLNCALRPSSSCASLIGFSNVSDYDKIDINIEYLVIFVVDLQ